MDIAALIVWLVTAGGGFVLLGMWIAHGGLRRETPGATRLAPPLVLGHGLLAAVGLVVWIAYLLSDDTTALAWTAFVLLLPVALLGFTMFARWWSDRRQAVATARLAEQRFPVPVVLLHGALAVATLVLVLLAALD